LQPDGSEIGNAIAQLFPEDFDEIVLTGFSKSVLPSFFGVVLQTPEPAAVENPARFGSLATGYVGSSFIRAASFAKSPSS
jgi:hypothetical protein